MARFSSTNHSTAVVATERERVWEVLTDPDLLAELTPLVRTIDADGDTWVWHLAGIHGLGMEVAPVFTETMVFEPMTQITYSHTPPPGRRERAGAAGWYHLDDAPTGTHLEIEITIHVELPLPRMSAPAVERIMAESMTRAGDAFARNLLAHLGLST